jgi:hypothetical protein
MHFAAASRTDGGMALTTSGPDATEKPAYIHTIPARTVAANLLPARILSHPTALTFERTVLVNYNTRAIASAPAVGVGSPLPEPAAGRCNIRLRPDLDPCSGAVAGRCFKNTSGETS